MKNPLAIEVVRQLERLGCSLHEPQAIEKPRGDDSFVVLEQEGDEWRGVGPPWEWARGTSRFPTTSAALYFLNGVTWNTLDWAREPDDDTEPTSVEMVSANENYEYRTARRRRVLYSFCYDATLQYYFSLDLLDGAADPTVYRVDHDGSSFTKEGSLSTFLATLFARTSGGQGSSG